MKLSGQSKNKSQKTKKGVKNHETFNNFFDSRDNIT
jgi:hypothetical protein